MFSCRLKGEFQFRRYENDYEGMRIKEEYSMI